jgi:predicted porin
MKKKLILAAISAALASPLAVQAEATMYGQVRIATQNASSNVSAGQSWGMADQVSRLGVKGSEDIGGGIRAIYKLEFGVNVGGGIVDNTLNNNANFWTQRNSYVGLDGAFGTFLMGRHDTPMKVSTAKLDMFADTQVDMDSGFGNPYAPTATGISANGVGLFDSLRSSGVLAYVSPSFAGFTLMGAVIQTNAGLSFEGNAPPKGDATDPVAGYSLAAMYGNGPWYGSVAFESVSAESGVGVNVPDYNKWRFGVGMLDFQHISASFIYEDREISSGGNGWNTESWQLQAGYEYLPGMHVKAMYGEFMGDIAFQQANGGSIDPIIAGVAAGSGRNFNTWAIGLQYDLSKRTDIQVLYRVKDVDSVGNPAAVAEMGNGMDQDIYAIQLDHSF